MKTHNQILWKLFYFFISKLFRFPTVKLTFDGFRDRMSKARTSRYTDHVNPKDFMKELAQQLQISENYLNQIDDDDSSCVIIKTNDISIECLQNVNTIYIDDFHKVRFQFLINFQI